MHRGLEKEIEEKENTQGVWSASAREDESKKVAGLFVVFDPKFAPNVRGRESKSLVEKP
jgi:hypothetical protein